MESAVVEKEIEESKTIEENISLKDFLIDFKDMLEEKVLEATKPLHNALEEEDNFTKIQKKRLSHLKRTLYPKQLNAVLALYKGYKSGKKNLILSAEMGSGKTIMALAVAYLMNAKRILVMSPGHLVRKWLREAEETIPNIALVNLNANNLKELLIMKENKGKKPIGTTIYVLGKERAKLHYASQSSYITNKRQQIICPDCGRIIEDEKVMEKVIHNKKTKCPNCNTPLYQPKDKPRRFAKAEFVKRYLPKGYFDFFIADEVHELKGGATAQGQAFADFVGSSTHSLSLTGTLMGGYATNLYYIFWRLFAHKMQGYDFFNASKFADDYGIVEETTINNTSTEEGYNNYSIGGSSKKRVYKKEKPGMSPLLLTDFLLENTVFMKLSDVSDALPAYKEEVVSVEMEQEQSNVYKQFEADIVEIVQRALARRDKSYLGALVQSLLGLPDGGRKGEVVYNPHNKTEIVASADAIDIDVLPKEQELIDIVSEENEEGRKVLVCLEHTGTRDLTGDLKERLENEGFSTAVLKANTVKPELREKWINGKVNDKEHPIDVLITNPRIIQTGLDLLNFPSIVFFQTGYSVYTLRQASRRSWRIGQEKEVKVYYLTYSDTMQEKALKLMASKMESALALEGDLSDKGLVALSESENSILFEIARELLKPTENKKMNELWDNLKQEESTIDDFIGESKNITKTVEDTTNTVIEKDGRVISDVTIRTKTVVRGRIYPKKDKGIAYVGRYKFIFSDGKITFNGKVVGSYKGSSGVINDKPIKIARAQGKNYYVLCELQKVS